MERNPKQQRMLYLRQLQREMNNYLYEEQERQRQSLLESIAMENQQLLDCITPTFMYENQQYSAPYVAYSDAIINKVLHTSLLKRVSDIVHHTDFDDVKTKAHINHMFTMVLGKAQQVSDLKQLLPSSFTGFITTIDPEIFNLDTPLSADEIQKLKEETADGLTYLNELFITRLLLTK